MSVDGKNHKDLLSDLISRLERDELPWYRREAKRNLAFSYAFPVIGLLFSLSAATCAALINGVQFEKSGGKLLLVLIPLFATACFGVAQVFRFREQEALRATGRIELESIIANAKSLLVIASSDAGYERAFSTTRRQFRAFELSQRLAHVGLRGEPQDDGARWRDGDERSADRNAENIVFPRLSAVELGRREGALTP